MTDEVTQTPEELDAAAKARAEADALEKEKSGNKPSDAEAKLLKEVMEKKEALIKQKQATEQAEARAKELEAVAAKFEGIDLEQVKELLKEKADRETADLEKRGEFDRVKAQMLEQHKKELEEAKATEGTRAAELAEKLATREKQINELTIGRGFSESNFIREDLTLTPSKARIIYGAHFELQDGKIVAYDKPAGTDTRTPLVDANGDPLDFEKAIAKLVDADPDRDNLLKSKIRSGAGSENDTNAKNKGQQKEVSGLGRIQAAMAAGQLPKMPK